MNRQVGYDISSHVFESYIKNGQYDPYLDTIVYDGGNLDNPVEYTNTDIDKLKDNGDLDESK